MEETPYKIYKKRRAEIFKEAIQKTNGLTHLMPLYLDVAVFECPFCEKIIRFKNKAHLRYHLNC